jgi:peptidoglycan/xylan/chitin deacetylase (PgdA/CDA1 family)
MSLRSTAMRGISSVLFHTGLVGRIGAAAGYVWPYAGYRVLTFHRVDDENDPFLPSMSTARFAARMAHIARHYVVLPLDELAERVRRGSAPRNALAITFDDGYRSNLTHAAPILARYGLPATVFLVSGYIGTPHALWFDRLALGLKNSRRSEVRLDGGPPLPLTTVEERLRALTAAQKYFKALPAREHQPQLERVLASLEPAALEPPKRFMLSWDEVHALRGLGFSIGAHTETHPILSRLEPEDARREIQGSRRAIERALGRPVTAFAYPNGGVDDYTSATVRLVAEAGFKCAVTTRRGLNTAATPPFELRRGGAWDMHLPTYALQTAYYQLTDG